MALAHTVPNDKTCCLSIGYEKQPDSGQLAYVAHWRHKAGCSRQLVVNKEACLSSTDDKSIGGVLSAGEGGRTTARGRGRPQSCVAREGWSGGTPGGSRRAFVNSRTCPAGRGPPGAVAARPWRLSSALFPLSSSSFPAPADAFRTGSSASIPAPFFWTGTRLRDLARFTQKKCHRHGKGIERDGWFESACAVSAPAQGDASAWPWPPPMVIAIGATMEHRSLPSEVRP